VDDAIKEVLGVSIFTREEPPGEGYVDLAP